MNNCKNFWRIFQSPLWLGSVFTEAKSFRDNPILGSSSLNRIGLHIFRMKIARTFATSRRYFLKQDLDSQKVEEYLKTGFIKDSEFLSAPEYSALKKEVFESDWLCHEMRQGSTVTRKVFLNRIELLDNYPLLASFIANPKVLARIRYVAGTGGQPVFSIQAILSKSNGVHDPQTDIHSDTFHSNAKAWFFLSNVEEENGPLSYVPGSHELTSKRLRWEKQQSVVAKHHPNIYHSRGSFRVTIPELNKMGFCAPKKFIVKENTLVVADTVGFHCRTPSVKDGCRVEIYATLRRNPYIPFLDFDLFSTPYIRNRIGIVSIFLLKILSKVGFKKMPWKLVGYKKINDQLS